MIFELGDGGVGPVEDGKPGNVGQGHGASGVGLAGDADGHGAQVGEPVVLYVAGGARAFVVYGQALVIEEVTAQFNFGG